MYENSELSDVEVSFEHHLKGMFEKLQATREELEVIRDLAIGDMLEGNLSTTSSGQQPSLLFDEKLLPCVRCALQELRVHNNKSAIIPKAETYSFSSTGNVFNTHTPKLARLLNPIIVKVCNEILDS